MQILHFKILLIYVLTKSIRKKKLIEFMENYDNLTWQYPDSYVLTSRVEPIN